jgi:hypothetical protein
MPTTADELDRLAKDYIRRTMRGGLGPAPISDAELGAGFRERLDDAPVEVQRIGGIIAASEADNSNLGRHLHQMAACGLFEQQLQTHQQKHSISGLVERTFDVPALGFSTVELSIGLWLNPLGDDEARLHRDAQRLGQEFRALADGAGASWLRYRELNFYTEDGTPAWRYVRDSWGALDAALDQARSASFSDGSFELGDASEAFLKLTVWVGGDGDGQGDGDAHTFLLVRPDQQERLDDQEAWWC